MLHHFFEHHGLGETSVHLHADNCSGQNKNKYMMWYLMWRTMVGLHEEVKISFLPVGHTKFAPNWCFGLAKQSFRRTKVNNLDDIANSVSMSSFVNVPQLVGTSDGACYVPTYNWSDFFDDHTIKTALKGIKSIQHFRFVATSPGVVHGKCKSSATERQIKLTKNNTWSPSAHHLPDFITPAGLSLQRQWYLFEKIREFCSDATKDEVCPKPSQPLPK